MALGAHLVAAGSAGKLLFWDRRSALQCGCFEDTHAEDVTQVYFHPRDAGRLFSGSEDGLVQLSSVAGTLDEDEGFLAALNTDSVARLGAYGGPDLERLWVQTHTERLFLWDWKAACDESAEGGAGPLAEVEDVREQLTAAAAGSPLGAVSMQLGCTYSVEADQLWLAASSAAGAAAVFPVAEPRTGGAGCAFGAPGAVLDGGHTDVVRAVLWPDTSTPTVFTGGEDGAVSKPIPANIQATADALLQMYQTKSGEEQGSIVAKHYAADARFVDPLMDVGTPREIHLAFYSLIKIFKDVEVHKKSVAWNTTPRLPAGFKAGTQQVVVYNQQTYHLSKRTINLDVSTYLTFDQEGKVVRHEDVWSNGFGMPGFMKKPNGVLSSGVFKLLGWGKQIDATKA
ncbi:hypothetical protein WJX81_006399 [Elliptochloris bilobata]|uniref:SnoaL-like domain-containing protein n=1 Tax=Elliptochloris bilobata TaxID=381761 RepID=A0AAW1SJT1_9CHLO